MGKKIIIGLALGVLLLLQSTASLASTVTFDINQTFSQGGVADLVATDISIGGAGIFTVDPGFVGNYFDFELPGNGTFSTIDTQIYNYYFLYSYAHGETVGSGNFGNHITQPSYAGYDWDTILVKGLTAGVWGSSHDGYLGFVTDANLYGWIEYSFTRSGSTSTLAFLSGAYNDVAGADITPAPEPATLMLFGMGLLGLAGVCRKKK